jgi:hypothetical protein
MYLLSENGSDFPSWVCVLLLKNTSMLGCRCDRQVGNRLFNLLGGVKWSVRKSNTAQHLNFEMVGAI